jgi:hypothetical protein
MQAAPTASLRAVTLAFIVSMVSRFLVVLPHRIELFDPSAAARKTLL